MLLVMRAKVRNRAVESARMYSAREIREENLIYWVTSYKTILKYMSHRKFSRILKPKVRGKASGKRYLVEGKNLQELIDRFERNELKGRIVSKKMKPIPKQRKARKEELSLTKNTKGWYNLRQVCNAKMLPGISTYHTFRAHLKAGKLKGLKVRLISSVDGEPVANRYWIKETDLRDYLKSKT